MATYVNYSRTNYFRVKDVPAFKAWAELRNLVLMEGPEEALEEDRMYGVYSSYGGFSYYDGDSDTDIDLLDELAPHLRDSEVAILMSVGYENMRYLTGVATAINNEGTTVHIDLDSIYDLAKSLGNNITKAEY